MTASSEAAAEPKLEPASAFRLDGQVVLVTGAGKGIGRAIAVAAAASGARVIGCSRTDADLELLRDEIGQTGGECETVVADIAETQGIEAMFGFALERAGRIDAVVNNAGVNVLRDALDYTEDVVDQIFTLNLRTVYWCCVHAARHMVDAGVRGSILNITSQASVVGAPGRAPYSAAKAGVNHLTRTLAKEWAPKGIRVNALAPTVTATPLGIRAMEQRPELAAEVATRVALVGRAAHVDEMSFPAVFMLSPAAALITGQTLVVDGGWTA